LEVKNITTVIGNNTQPAFKRRVAADLLQEEHEEEEQDGEAGIHRERLDVPRGEVAMGEKQAQRATWDRGARDS